MKILKRIAIVLMSIALAISLLFNLMYAWSASEIQMTVEPDQITLHDGSYELQIAKFLFLTEDHSEIVSSFRDFRIEENKVYFDCYLAIENSYSVDKTVTIHGYYPEDEQSGLLTSARVDVLDENGEPLLIHIPANRIVIFTANFVGDWGGSCQEKQDRSMPYCVIDVVD